MKLRSLLAQWSPPAVTRLARSLERRVTGQAQQHKFEGLYSSWQEAAARSIGYDSPIIFEKTRAATLQVLKGEGAFEQDSVVFEHANYPLFLVSSLLHVATANGGRLSVMDFGGALGSSYHRCRPFLTAVRDLRWAVVEQPHYVKYGQAEMQTDVLRFHGVIEDCVRIEEPNVAVLSGVLAIVEDPYAIIDRIIAQRIDYVIVDRQALVPSLMAEEERVCVETVPASIYEGSYPFWLLSEPRFREAWTRAYDLVAEAETDPLLPTHVGPLPQRQFLLVRRR